jgi:ribonucleoside-triphosphate reductase
MTSEENDNENLPRMTDTFSTAGLQHPLSPVGFITFMRTYSRRLDPGDPNSAVETFAQTLERVVRASNTQLGVGFTEEEQREFFLLLYKLKCSVAGRFLWQLGTATVDRLGLLSLQNCALCVIDEPVMPFVWAADCLMLGSGVGFNICPENVDKLPVVQAATVTRCDQNDADFIVPDSREGWIKLLGKVFKAHFYSGKDFTYATICLRSKGAPIKGFGGLASGPEVLCDGINKINTVLNGCAGRKLRPVDALDIMNIIGMIVVSGNVRRYVKIRVSLQTRPPLFFFHTRVTLLLSTGPRRSPLGVRKIRTT